MSYSVSGDVRIWVNNTEQTTQDSGAGSGNINDNNMLVGIGCSYEDGVMVHQYDGLIDDVRIYNSLITDFSDSQELTGNEATLIGYWKLNNTYDDTTTNNNDLTTANTPTFSTDIPFSQGAGSSPTTTLYTYTYATSTHTQRQYIGEYYQPESELSYLNARWYDGERGRFLSQDPVFLAIGARYLSQISGKLLTDYLTDPQQLNSYSYARNNPLVFSDPTGNDLYWRSDGTLALQTNTGFNQYFESQDIVMLSRNATLGEANKGNISLFASLVRPGGSWDYKNTGGRDYYFFNGELVKAEVFGNLHYGYSGTAFGIGSEILTDAAGVVQINRAGKDNKGPTLTNVLGNYDAPEDTRNINIGISVYNNSLRVDSSANYARASNVAYNATINSLVNVVSALAAVVTKLALLVSSN